MTRVVTFDLDDPVTYSILQQRELQEEELLAAAKEVDFYRREMELEDGARLALAGLWSDSDTF